MTAAQITVDHEAVIRGQDGKPVLVEGMVLAWLDLLPEGCEFRYPSSDRGPVGTRGPYRAVHKAVLVEVVSDDDPVTITRGELRTLLKVWGTAERMHRGDPAAEALSVRLNDEHSLGLT